MRELFSLPVSSTDQHDVLDRNNADSRALSSFAQNASSSFEEFDVKVRVAKSRSPESDLLGRGVVAPHLETPRLMVKVNRLLLISSIS